MSKDTCVFMFGRFQPVHIGHGLVFDEAERISTELDAELKLFISATVDDVKNPLPLDLKKYYIDGFYPSIGSVIHNSTKIQLFDIMTELDKKYDNVIFIGGSDRKDDFQKTLDRYNGSLYHFNSIKTVLAGSSRENSIYSSTMMRACAVNEDYDTFRKALPGNDEVLKYQMFNDVLSRIKR